MSNTPEGLTIFFSLTEGIGAIFIILVGVWLWYYRGGFAWTSNPSLEFNWHPLLLSIGLIYLYANSVIVYRAFRNCNKRTLKLAHTVIHGCAFVITVIGLQAVFDSHNLAKTPIPNMYSLHSWVGLTAVILFACQWVSGLFAFMFPFLGGPLRSAYLPVHVFFGLGGFALAVAAALLGFNEKAFFSIRNYSELPGEAILVNIIGISMIIFSLLTVYIATEPSYKRHPLPEDTMLLGEPDGHTSLQNYSELSGETVSVNIIGIGISMIIFSLLTASEPNYQRHPLPEDTMLVCEPVFAQTCHIHHK